MKDNLIQFGVVAAVILVVLGLCELGSPWMRHHTFGWFVPATWALETARTMGFTELEVVNTDVLWIRSLGGCSPEDYKRIDLRGKNSLGEQVDVSVCCGMLKSCTLRGK